jgi:uncharacterized protein YbjT (DUF2867 family)
MSASAASGAARRLVIFGGSGFVGSAAAAEALQRGLAVTCLSRSGQAPAGLASLPWAQRASWAKADALQPDSYRQHLAGADAVIVAIGSPPLPFVDRAYQASDSRHATNAPRVHAALARCVARCACARRAELLCLHHARARSCA